MEATIEHSERRGGFLWLDLFYRVSVTVRFAKRELDIIKRQKLGNTLVLKRKPSATVHPEMAKQYPDAWPLTLGLLVHGTDVHEFWTPLEAKNYDHALRKALPVIKHFIEGNVFAPTTVHWYEV